MCHRDRYGLTLIEVLVVIAIIGLIMAIVVPSMMRARENARSAVCRSNLGQWGRMLQMYAQQNNDFLPYEDRGDEAMGRICWYDSMDWTTPASAAPQGVAACPTALLDEPNRQESYRMNSKLAETLATSPYYMPYRNLGKLRLHAQTIILFDADVGGSTLSFKGRWRLRNDDVNYRHSDKTNFLFGDFHVDNYKKGTVKEQSIQNGPLVWQPDDMGPWDPEP